MMSGKLFLKVILCFGFLFLYVPIFLLVVYSFNASQLVTVWAGFSTHWYDVLFQDADVGGALRLSLFVGMLSATAATVIGTLAGYVLSRYRLFSGRSLFFGLISAPLFMPEIIMGIALLLMYVSLQQIIGFPSERGTLTLFLSHTTFCSAFVAVIVQGRMAGMDQSVEEAAMDLGARPVVVFFLVTVPRIAPAMVAGWLLAFSLSLDNVVISQFVSGPTTTTLPMLVFSRTRLGITPETNALASVVVLIVVVLAGCFMLWQWLTAPKFHDHGVGARIVNGVVVGNRQSQ